MPYWVDDESVRASMVASASVMPIEAAAPSAPVTEPAPSGAAEPRPRVHKPGRNMSEMDELKHPLLGKEPTLKLMPDPDQVCSSGLGGRS